MSKQDKATPANGSTNSEKTRARSGAIFSRGIRTDRDFLEACVAVADDLAHTRFSASVGNAIGVNTRNMIKMLELKFKYGVAEQGGGEKVLRLGGE